MDHNPELLDEVDKFLWARLKHLHISRGATELEWRVATEYAQSHKEFQDILDGRA